MSKSRPNLLFIFTDEQALSAVGAYGSSIDTPHLDALAEESILWEQAYVTQPVCTPSRASLLTGLYPHTNGCTENNLPLAADIPCLPELGDFAGYETAYFGKWHLGDEIYPQHGFTHWRSIDDLYYEYYGPGRDRSQASSYTEWLKRAGYTPDVTNEDGMKGFSRDFCARLPEEYSKPAYLGGEASRFLQESQDSPFILCVNFFEPHMPFYGPRDGQYDPDAVHIPDSFATPLGPDTPLKERLFQQAYETQGHSGMPLRTEADWRRLIANYWGLASQVDTYVGQILDTLAACGLADDTIVVFTSDHGDMMGAHRLLAKCVMYEEAVRVPLFVRFPGLAPRRIAEPVSQVDLVPTLLDAMNQAIPESLQGGSWLPFLHGTGPAPAEDVFIEWNGQNTGFGDVLGGVRILECWRKLASEAEIREAIADPVRTIVTRDGWKFTFSPRGEHKLYNLGTDPGETVNVAWHAEHKTRIAELCRRIRAFQDRTNDPAPRAWFAGDWE